MKINKKSMVFGFFVVLLLLAGGWFGYHKYASIRQAHLISQAKSYMDKGNARKALLFVQRALHYNPKDVEACRLMADLAESAHSPGAIMWRSRVVKLNPGSLDDRLSYAETALSLGNYAVATNALSQVGEAGKKSEAYHNVAGAAAAAVHQFAKAETEFSEAERLEPQNLNPKLNLALVRLQTTNAQAQAEGRESLRQLAANPTNSVMRNEAMRELVADDMRYKKVADALAMSKKLVEQTNATFKDTVLRLTVLHGANSPEFKSTLAAAQNEAASETTGIDKAYELGTWEMLSLGPADTQLWLQSLPSDVQTNQTVATLMCECYTMQKDWGRLQAFVEHQNWYEVDFLRLGFETAALRGQGLEGAAKGKWEQAFQIAKRQADNGQSGSLVMLLRLALQWRWQVESEDILWAVVNEDPREKWALQALTEDLYIGGRTRSLLKLFSQEEQRDPADLSIKNNLAMTAMLLGAQEYKPYELAREAYQGTPTNSGYASTYAFSLHLQKKDPEALKVLQQIPQRDLNNPAVAGYYGLVLVGLGDKEKARPYLLSALKAPILPEERDLFDQASAGM